MIPQRTPPTSRRGGYTIVELLVVVGLIATLFSLIAVGMRPGTNSQVLRAARLLASSIVAAQTRALGSESGSAVIFEVDSAPPGGCQRINDAAAEPLLLGTATGDFDRAATSAAVQVNTTSGCETQLPRAYRIQFHGDEGGQPQPPSPWYAFVGDISGSGTASLRGSAGQTLDNTIWPVNDGGTPLGVSLTCYPSKGPTSTDLPSLAAIDLRYSGVGNDPATTYGSLNGKGAIGLGFDRLGAVEAVMLDVLGQPTGRPEPLEPSGPVFFLVAAKKAIETGANTLASDAAVWVVVDSATGKVTLSSNVPQQGTDAASLAAARAKARAGTPVGR